MSSISKKIIIFVLCVAMLTSYDAPSPANAKLIEEFPEFELKANKTEALADGKDEIVIQFDINLYRCSETKTIVYQKNACRRVYADYDEELKFTAIPYTELEHLPKFQYEQSGDPPQWSDYRFKVSYHGVEGAIIKDKEIVYKKGGKPPYAPIRVRSSKPGYVELEVRYAFTPGGMDASYLNAKKILLTFVPSSGKKGFFTDVLPEHQNYDAIQYLKTKGMVNDFNGETFRPDETITRADAAKIIGGPKTDPLAQPKDKITFIEAAATIVKNFGSPVALDRQIWYRPYVQRLAENNAIPLTIFLLNKEITRGEFAEIIYRLKEKIADKPSLTYSQLERIWIATYRGKILGGDSKQVPNGLSAEEKKLCFETVARNNLYGFYTMPSQYISVLPLKRYTESQIPGTVQKNNGHLCSVVIKNFPFGDDHTKIVDLTTGEIFSFIDGPQNFIVAEENKARKIAEQNTQFAHFLSEQPRVFTAFGEDRTFWVSGPLVCYKRCILSYWYNEVVIAQVEVDSEKKIVVKFETF